MTSQTSTPIRSQAAGDRTTRRQFVRDAGIATFAATNLLTVSSATAGLRNGRRETVAVFGGGIAGLTAAHELAERGFDVTLYEHRAWGGKARSTEVPNSASGGRKPLPGEHSWRLFAGFYQNTVDTMHRIPFGDNPNGVFDNLVGDSEFLGSRANGTRDFVWNLQTVSAQGTSPQLLVTLFSSLLVDAGVPPQAIEHLAARLVVFLSSCDARRTGQWENTRWTDFIDAPAYGESYRKIIVDTLSQVVQASKAEGTSALFCAHVLEWVVYNAIGRASNGPFIRSLNRPTNEALIEPWLGVLQSHGARLRLGHELTGFVTRHGRIAGARVRSRRGTSIVESDWYVCALPVERARRLWTREILSADPDLGRMWKLDTAWMNGLKFFLNKRTPIAPGHVDYVDSPWRVTSISQAQFWPLDFAATYGDGRTHESLSAIISDWTTPGVLYGRSAKDCSPAEVVEEVWEQMKRHVNKPGETPVLTDDLIVSWNIDPGMIRRGGRLISEDPLVLPTVGQRPDRPDVTTAIPNLMLCGDYLKSDWEVAIMETASYNARRAANAIIDRSGSREPPCRTIGPVRPVEWEPFKRIDEDRWRRGQPNLFDTGQTAEQLQQLFSTGARLGA